MILQTVVETKLAGLTFLGRGKVRDIYEVDGKLLLVASDRLSAFDVVMPDGIPGKGQVLNRISAFWFRRLSGVIPNHMLSIDVADFPAAARPHAATLRGRAMLCMKAAPLPIECVVRGYLSGSGWKDYKATGAVCGIPLAAGLRESEKLPAPIFTPSTKATSGHDENISFEEAAKSVGRPLAEKVRDISIEIYRRATELAAARGILIADTKFEFGLDGEEVVWIDEALTPDSSRFWPMDTYAPGSSPPSFDKQFVRDYLETLAWNKQPPGPELPPEVVARTLEKYTEAEERLRGAAR